MLLQCCPRPRAILHIHATGRGGLQGRPGEERGGEDKPAAPLPYRHLRCTAAAAASAVAAAAAAVVVVVVSPRRRRRPSTPIEPIAVQTNIYRRACKVGVFFFFQEIKPECGSRRGAGAGAAVIRRTPF